MSRPWMPLYVADYLADTAHLSTIESGAYLFLIMHYWQNGYLPNEEDRLARIARMTPKEWARHREVLARFFKDDWTHDRIDDELKAAMDAYERRAKAGKKGGNAKAAGHQNGSNATAMLKQSQSHYIINNNIHSKKESARDPDASSPSGEKGFPESDFRAFPPSGTIAYTPFEAVCRRKAPGADPDRVADNFRRFCGKNGIDMSAPNIWPKWGTFCAKHDMNGLRSATPDQRNAG